ncbi:MAG: beta-propeller domain-containing protein [Agarilytica sp.]
MVITNIKSICKLGLTTASIALVTACGGSHNNSSSEETGEIAISDYANLQKSDVEATELKYATGDELLTHLKNGIRLSVYIHDHDDRDLDIPTPVPEPMATVAPGTVVELRTVSELSDSINLSAESDSSGNFSETNTHVAGVDEADYIKYDGQYLYQSTNREQIDDVIYPARIRILESTPDSASIEEITSIRVEEDSYWNPVDELYLVEGESATSALVSLQSAWNTYSVGGPLTTLVADYITTTEESIKLNNYDLSNPKAPELYSTIEIDGYLVDSRKIGNTLFLVSRFSPDIPHVRFYVSEEEAKENESHIAALTLDDLLPKIRINDTEENLVNANDCLIPLTADATRGYPSLTTIVSIDLESMSLNSANCLNSKVQGIYANASSLYVGGSSYSNWSSFNSFTVFHKFELADQLTYRSTGIAPGTLGWRDAAFRMSEFDGSFRVVTSERDNLSRDWVHRLSIFQDNPTTDQMEIVAQLPNESAPTAIGKPGEDIYAVRFVQERAYIVTFQRIDPLYVLDLSNPAEPSIEGELELPGFSTYLHPVDDNYLLGIGQDADGDGRVNGVQVNLFDIGDINNPALISNETFGGRGTWSPALNDLRAISFLRTSQDQLRFSFPISLYEEGSTYQWQDDALHLFEINGLETGEASLSTIGKMVAEENSTERSWPWYSGVDRSVLDGDAVYYAHGNWVWSAFWSNPEIANGPH